MPRNGNTTRRGYGTKHQTTRALLAPSVARGQRTCWRCHRPIPPPPPEHTCRKGCRSPACWDLGHDDHDRAITRGPEHRHRQPYCRGNRSTGATLGNKQRATRTPARPGRPARARQLDGPTLVDDDW